MERQQKKNVFKKIAEQFTKISGHAFTGKHCMRKQGKITSKQKRIEDHNNKSGNDKKTWKFYNELSSCRAKNPTVSPTCMLESSQRTRIQKMGKAASCQMMDHHQSPSQTKPTAIHPK